MTFVKEGLSATSNMDVTAANFVNVKVVYLEEIRRFAIPAPTLATLEARARTLFTIVPDARLDLFYRDSDGDLVTMTSEEELQHAVQLGHGDLRLEVRIKQGVAPTAAAPPSQLEQEDAGFYGNFHRFPGAMRGNRGMRGMGAMRGWNQMHGMRGGMMPPGFHGPAGLEHAGFPPGFDHHKMHHHMKKWGRKYGYCHDSEDSFDTKEKLTARHVKDVTVPDGTSMPPKTPFVKIWRVRNEGLEWPAGTRLIFISKKGDHMGGPDFVAIQGPVLPNAEIDISVNLVTPDDLGEYTGVWRLCTADGKKFGQRLWVSVTVASGSSSDEFEHIANDGVMDALVQKVSEMGFDVPRRKVERLMKKYGGNQDMVVDKLAKKADRNKSFGEWHDAHHRRHHGRHGHHGFDPSAGAEDPRTSAFGFHGRGGFPGRFGSPRGGFEGCGRGGFEGARGGC